MTVLDRRHDRGKPLTWEFFLHSSEPEPNSGCWIWMKTAPNGYGIVRHGGRNWPAHRLSYAIAHNVEVSAGIDVCHKCDNKLCVNPEHLFLGSRLDNMRDCIRKGRFSYLRPLLGDESPNSKLTSTQVREIRSDSRSNRALAKVYGVNKNTISCIRRRLTWISA